MSRPIEKLLQDLLPENGGAPLPTTLVELASSILAHSKIKATAVGADQEVARPHVCVHIACDRLKTSLNLPAIHSRPPIPPRPYKKLYDYINASVPNSALFTGATPKTPRKNRNPDSQPGSRSRQRPLPSRVTPGKDASLAQFRTPSRAGAVDWSPTKSTVRAVRTSNAGAGLAPWIQPTIRFICLATECPHLAPTIFAGIETSVAPGGKPTKDDWIQANLAGLVGAIYFFVVMHVHRLQTGQDVDQTTYPKMRRDIMALLVRARKEVVVKGFQDDAEGANAAWYGFEPISSTRDFNNVVWEIKERQWLNNDWFRDLADVLRHQGQLEEDDGTDEAATVQVRRADTMLQDQYDFLSRGRVAEYNMWKTEMLARIQELENAPAADPMDVDMTND